MQPVRILIIVGILLPPLLGACTKTELSEAEMKSKSLKIFQKLQKNLGASLQSAIKSQGVPAAIEVCKQVSPQVETGLSRHPVLKIRRISAKNRNPLHQPDEFEKQILEKWRAELKAGKALSLQTIRTKTEYRVMKPIVIKKAVCLNCHGMDKNIKPLVLNKINELYPQDLARGYKLGDLRGAFSSRWRLKN